MLTLSLVVIAGLMLPQDAFGCQPGVQLHCCQSDCCNQQERQCSCSIKGDNIPQAPLLLTQSDIRLKPVLPVSLANIRHSLPLVLEQRNNSQAYIANYCPKSNKIYILQRSLLI